MVFGLPRVSRTQPGKHHGWRLPGYQRSFRIPDYMPETVPALADLGRGSPTGVHVYKGAAFPKNYQGGLFIADWTFGRIHHLQLVQDGGGYVSRPEVFIEPIGTAGFAPTDIVETQDGALLISIGGRKTRARCIAWRPRKRARTPLPCRPWRKPIRHRRSPCSNSPAVQAKMGGWKLGGAAAEAFVPYQPAKTEVLAKEEQGAAFTLAENGLFALDDRVVVEAARTLAMLESKSSRDAGNILAKITEKSTVTADFHFLACLARIAAEPDAERTTKIAHAILDLDRKLAGGDRRPKQMWPVRLNEVVRRLIELNPGLPEALLAHPTFATAGHLPLVDVLPKDSQRKASALYLAVAKSSPDLEWSPDLIKLLGREADARPLLRAQWKNIGLRAALRGVLGNNPSPEDTALLSEKEQPVAVEDPSATAAFVESLKPVAWDKGDAAKGEKLFRERACATCHTGTSPIGPDLSGPVARLSAPDLMTDIQFPNRAIAEAFRTKLFTLKDGSARNGFVAFLSADGVIVQTGPGMTERISQSDIVSEAESKTSLMPPGLLSGLDAGQFADLYAYLRTLAK